MVTNREGLALVSKTPGRTSAINFFTINDAWGIVDLPGYGFARATKKQKGRFNNAIADYLQHRVNLAGTFVLIDSKLPPQAIDLEFIEWMVTCELLFALVFTKRDRVSGGAASRNVDAFLELFKEISEEPPEVVLSSSKTGKGRQEILKLITAALAEASGIPEFVVDEEEEEFDPDVV